MSKLNKLEMACISSCVPCSGDLEIDRVIHVSLRLKLATQFLEAMISKHGVPITGMRKEFTNDAMVMADALLSQFEGKQPE